MKSLRENKLSAFYRQKILVGKKKIWQLWKAQQKM